MAKDLTALAVATAKPGPARREIADGKVRGLYLVVQPSGARSWALRYRSPAGESRKLTLGSIEALDLPSARRSAGKALLEIGEGHDPAAAKSAARIATRKPAEHKLVENAVARFIERHAKAHTRETSWREAERLLKAEIVTYWRGQSIDAIGKSDIHVILDRIIDRGSPIAANRALAVMSRFFNWAAERELIAVAPTAGVRPPSATRSRDRVLSDHEIGLVWNAATVMGWPFGTIVQLLLLTGQRRDEVAALTWDEVDPAEAVWTLPASRSKNGKGHSVPLTPAAIDILAGIPRMANIDFLFSVTGRTPVSGFTKARERLAGLCAEANGGVGLPAFTLHDLRRTLASGCARLGVTPHVVEAILNHRSGTIRGVAAVYNRHTYAEEKRAALLLWSQHMKSIASGNRKS